MEVHRLTGRRRNWIATPRERQTGDKQETQKGEQNNRNT